MTQDSNGVRALFGQSEAEDIKTLGDLLEACRSPGKRRQVAARMGLCEAEIEAGLSLVYPETESDLARKVVGVLAAAGVGVKSIG